MSSRTRQLGFTLVELMVVLVIAAILLTAAVPGMRGVLRNQARSGLLNEMTASIRFARAEAARFGRATAICASADGKTCSRERLADYGEGWIVFIDADGDGAKDDSDADNDGEIDPLDEPVRRVFKPPADTTRSLRMLDRSGVTARFARVTSFDRAGRLRNFGSTSANISEPRFVYCDGDGVRGAHALFVTVTGRTVLTRDDNGDGLDDYAGEALICA